MQSEGKAGNVEVIRSVRISAQARLDVVIVCYNCAADILTLTQEMKAGEFLLEDLHLIVVDNASADDSLALLSTLDGMNVTVVASKHNIGFGRGCNLALPHLQGEHVLFLNPDVHLESGSLARLYQFACGNPQARIWGGLTLGEQGTPDGMSGWREPGLTGLLCWAFFIDSLRLRLGLPTYDAYDFSRSFVQQEVDAVSGCFLMMERQVLEQLQGFDPRFFMYSEEIDLCRRAREQMGARPLICGDARIIHLGSRTISSARKLDFLYYYKLKYFQKHQRVAGFWLARLLVRTGSQLRAWLYQAAALLQPRRKAQAELWSQFVRLQRGWKF